MSYDDPQGLVDSEINQDLYQSVIPQLSVKDIVSSKPSNPSAGEAYIIDRSSQPSNEPISSQKSFRFDSSNKEYIKIPSSRPWSDWDGISSFTLEIYFETTDTSHNHLLFTTRDRPNVTERVEAELKTNGNVQFRVRDSSGNRHSITKSFPFDLFDGNGHLYTLQRDASEYGNSEAMDIYVNGKSGTQENEIIDSTVSDVSNNQIFIGKPYEPRAGTQTMIEFPQAGDVVTVPDSNSLDFTGDFTLEFIWNQANTNNQAHSILDKTDLTGSGGWSIRFSGDSQLIFIVDTGNGLSSIGSSRFLFDYVGQDVHLAFVREGQWAYIIFNGQIVGKSKSLSGNTKTNAHDLLIGGGIRNGDQIDEIRLWSESRLNEVRDNPFSTYTGSETNLEAYYKCNDDSDTSTLLDETSNNNDGSINGPNYVTKTVPGFSGSNWPDGDVKEFRIWNDAISEDVITDNKNSMVTGREENLSLYLPLVSEYDITQRLTQDYTANESGGNYNARSNNGILTRWHGPELVNDGIVLSSSTPSIINGLYDFEDAESLPLILIDTSIPGVNNLQSFSGDWSFHSGHDPIVDGRLAILSPSNTQNILNGYLLDKFSWYYWQSQDSQGGGIRFRNTSGEFETAFADDHTEWVLDDGSGNEEVIYSGDGFERWIYVEFSFDWSNNQYGYYIEDQQSGTVKQGTRDLVTGKDVSSIEIWSYHTGNTEPWNGRNEANIHYDDIKIESNNNTFDGRDGQIAVYNGTSWRFFDPDGIKNPRAFIQSLDRVYRYYNGTWGEIQTSATANNTAKIKRIESGSLPSNPNDNDAVVDARHGDIEWLRVYNSSNDTWELEGVGENILRVDDKNFHWNEGALDNSLVVTSGSLELQTS